MAEESIFGTICAVVVTYNIGNGFERCFKSLKGQVDHAVMVNTSTDDGVTSKALKSLKSDNKTFVDVVECPQNNLAMAQNLGIEKALEAGADWILLLDHDSCLKAGMIAAMETAFRAEPKPLRWGLIAPFLTDPDLREQPRYLKSVHKYWFKQAAFELGTPVIHDVLCVSASGSLIPARLLRDDTLRMDEEFVIDGVDTDFCLRLQRQGFHIMAVRDAKLEHKIGERRRHRFMGLSITTTHHAPLRRYYLYRNRMRIWARYGWHMPGFFAFDLLRVVYEWWRILLFETNKNEKLKAMLSGVGDGVRGIYGPKPGMDLTRTADDKGE